MVMPQLYGGKKKKKERKKTNDTESEIHFFSLLLKAEGGKSY